MSPVRFFDTVTDNILKNSQQLLTLDDNRLLDKFLITYQKRKKKKPCTFGYVLLTTTVWS